MHLEGIRPFASGGGIATYPATKLEHASLSAITSADGSKTVLLMMASRSKYLIQEKITHRRVSSIVRSSACANSKQLPNTALTGRSTHCSALCGGGAEFHWFGVPIISSELAPTVFAMTT